MADVDLTVYDCDDDGIANLTDKYTEVATDNDYYFPNNGQCKLFVDNASGDTVTVTVETPGTVGELVIADKTVTLATAKVDLLGPFAPSVFNDQNREVHVTFDKVVNVVVVRG